jgi:protein tyrosine/serine phosphatase
MYGSLFPEHPLQTTIENESAYMTPAIISIVAFLVVAIILRQLVVTFRIRRFHIVEKAGMYRGGQPTVKSLWFLAKIMKIKTVINLREDFKENEKLFGMTEHRILLPPRTNIPTMEQVEDFFKIVDDPENRPILVHCKVGANRTGIMIATYRIHRQGWSFDDALAEMKRVSRKVVRDHAVECLREISQRSFPKASASAAKAP